MENQILILGRSEEQQFFFFFFFFTTWYLSIAFGAFREYFPHNCFIILIIAKIYLCVIQQLEDKT